MILHDKRWDIYMNDKNLINRGYSLEASVSDGNKVMGRRSFGEW